MAFWVYMVRCADGAYYIGSHRGESVLGRVHEHNEGRFHDAWTFRRRAVELVWSAEFQRVMDAVAWERRIKGWSRAKKEALIVGDWVEIQRLAKARPTD